MVQRYRMSLLSFLILACAIGACAGVLFRRKRAESLSEAMLGYARGCEGAAVLRLVDSGAAVDSIDSSGCTALFYAVDCEDMNLVSELLDRGADPNIGSRWQYSPLCASINTINSRALELLLKHDASPIGFGKSWDDVVEYAKLTRNERLVELVQEAAESSDFD